MTANTPPHGPTPALRHAVVPETGLADRRTERDQLPWHRVRLSVVIPVFNEEDNLPVLYEQQLDPEAAAMAAFVPRDREAFFAHWKTRILADDAVEKKTILFDGKVAGNIVCFEQQGKTLVGYWIGREYWGKGIATRALAALRDQVKQRPLYAYVAAHNIGSIRVLQKCGFTVCGKSRVRPREDDGEIDELIYRLDEPPYEPA